MKWKQGDRVIRQAISCDICGTEMLNSNHWFVARTTGRELRISLWDPQSRLRAVKHLCGHKCLHQLLDDFTAQTLHVTSANMRQPQTDSGAIDTTSASSAALPIHARQSTDSRSSEAVASAHFVAPLELGAKRIVIPNGLHADAWKRERERQRAAEKRSIA